MPLWGNTDTNKNEPKYIGLGQVLHVNITLAGTGYTTVPTIAFNTPTGGRAATATCSLNASGGVGAVNIIDPGAGYSSAIPAIITFSAPTSGTTAMALAVFNPIDAHLTGHESILFLSIDQAKLTANRVLGMKTPGWFSYRTYTDNKGEVRHKVEPLVAFALPESFTGKNPLNTIVTG